MSTQYKAFLRGAYSAFDLVPNISKSEFLRTKPVNQRMNQNFRIVGSRIQKALVTYGKQARSQQAAEQCSTTPTE